MEERIAQLESEVALLKARNAKVEINKTWELSRTRILGIALTTYGTMNLLLWTIGGPFPPIHAIVPTAGFVLSTISIPWLKKWWIKKYYS